MSDRIEIDLSKYEDIEIPAEMIDKIDQLTNTRDPHYKRAFTPEEDKILLTYWPIKHKKQLSKLLGMSYNTCSRRFKELTE